MGAPGLKAIGWATDQVKFIQGLSDFHEQHLAKWRTAALSQVVSRTEKYMPIFHVCMILVTFLWAGLIYIHKNLKGKEFVSIAIQLENCKIKWTIGITFLKDFRSFSAMKGLKKENKY